MSVYFNVYSTRVWVKYTSSLTRLISIIPRNFKILLRNRFNFYNLRVTLRAFHLHTFTRYSSFHNILFDEDCMFVYFFYFVSRQTKW